MGLQERKSLFLSLPLEIRLLIYRSALTCMRSDGSVAPYTFVACRCYLVPPTPGLLRTNRQIHLEAAPILYGGNTFNFLLPTSQWFKQIGTCNVGSIRHLRIHLDAFGSRTWTEDWCVMCHQLSQQASNLTNLYLEFDSLMSRLEPFIVWCLREIRSLETIELAGAYSESWPKWLRSTLDARIIEITHEK